MTGQVQADDSNVYLLHGWKGNEDEDVDIDSIGGSSEEAIQSFENQGDANPVLLDETANSNKVPPSPETSSVGDQECDSLVAKSQMQVTGASENVGHILNQTIVSNRDGGKEFPEKSLGPKEKSTENSSSQPKQLNAGKRLDARRFRDHFAAKLVGSRRSNVIPGNTREEASSAQSSKDVLDGFPEPSKAVNDTMIAMDGKGVSDGLAEPSKAGNDVLTAVEEPAVVLHVNLEVEQEKDIEVPCNGDCNAGSKESFQVFTRKRKQASEGATQSDKIYDPERNEVQVETIDDRDSDPKDSGCTLHMQLENEKPNTIHGRSKRARKHNRPTDYIPWSDFGRLPTKKCEGNRSDVLVDGTATEVNARQFGSKISSNSIPEGNTECNKETRASSIVSATKDPKLDDEVNQSSLQTIPALNVVEKEVDKEAPANKDNLTCPVGKEPELCTDSGTTLLSIQGKSCCQDSLRDATEIQEGLANCSRLSNGTVDATTEGRLCRADVLLDNTREDECLHSDVNRVPDPKTQIQKCEGASGLSRLSSSHNGDNARESMTEASGMLDYPSVQQGSIKFPKVAQIDDHDSVCHKCNQGGQLICCDGKNCEVTFHIDCLDPPLRDIPPNDWYCPCCACKRIFGGRHSVSKGIESIWDVKVGNDDSDRVGVGAGLKQPEADTEGTVNLMEKSLSNSKCAENCYFVKYKQVAHAHNQWLGESELSKEAPNLLINFKKQVEQGKAPKWDPEWVKPFRVIGKRKTMIANIAEVFPDRTDSIDAGHFIEWCVKWKNLGYEACTWEPADRAPLDSAYSKKLIADYETRSAKAMQWNKAKDTCKVELPLNSKVQSDMFVDHASLSEVIEKLISLWKKGINSIAVNEIHQDRMKTAIGFLLSLYEKFAISRPCCVIVSPLLLGEWRAALKKWMPNINMVVYAGSKEARKVIQRYEFYNEDGSCMVQIVLTNFDIVNLDKETLSHLNFKALIVDECQKLKGTKTCKSLQHFSSAYRLLLLSEPMKNNVEGFQYIAKELAGGKEGMPLEENATLLQLKTLVSQHIVQEAKQESSGATEFWVPVQMTRFQLEQYCKLLTDNHDSLVRGKRGDIVSSPQELLLKLRECCNHPFLVRPGFQESLTNLSAKELLDYGIGASGKLKFLDEMLCRAKSSNKRVVIITQINLRAGIVSLMDVLDDYMRQQFGIDSYERLDGGVQTGKKSAAVQRFNAPNSKCFVFLLDRRACASSIKPQAVNCIVIFDSDWNPLTDIQSFLRMFSPEELERIAICRFYCTQTIEERVLISARKNSDLDSNYHNFTLAACQKMLRWGASKNFERFDRFSRDKAMSINEVMYSPEMIDHFLAKGAPQSDKVDASNSLLTTALFPRRAGEYSRGVPLYGENDKALAEERISAAEFWTDLLKDRQVEAPDVQVRELRTRKKVQYLEDPFDVPNNTSQMSADDEEESRRKRRKVVEVFEPSNLGRGGRAPSVERSPLVGADGENQSVKNMERPGTNKVDNFERAASLHLKSGAGDVGYSLTGIDKGDASKTSVRNTKSIGNSEISVNETANSDPAAAAKSEQQQVLDTMKSDLEKLCRALQFQADTAEHVGQLLLSVGNFFKLPKERSLLHAIELSLCWLAAEQQHYSIDRRATLSLAESCFGVQLDKIETVYAKLEERWKKRLEQGVQQFQGTRSQEKDSTHGAEQDRNGKVLEQEVLAGKHYSNQMPDNSMEGSRVGSEEPSAPRDAQLPKQGPIILATREQHQDSGPHEAQTSSMASEQIPLEQAGTSASIPGISLEPSADANRISVSQQQRNDRSQLINSQKLQIGTLEQLERKYRHKLKQHYDSAIAKLPKTSSSEEQVKLLNNWKIASKVLINVFRVKRANLIKHQNEERGKEQRLSNEQLGRIESLNTRNDYSEDRIFMSLPQWLRTTIDTGDFGSVRAMSGLDHANSPSLNTGNASSSTSVRSILPSAQQSQPVSSALISGTTVSESPGHFSSNSQQQGHGEQQKQAHDSLLQQKRLSILANDPVNSQVVSLSAAQNQHRQHPSFQQQQLSPVTSAQTILASTPRASPPTSLSQQPGLSQAPFFPESTHIISETQQSPMQQIVHQVPARYGYQPTTGSSLTLPNEVAPLLVSATLAAPHISVRASSGATATSSRILPSSQSRSNQQYHNDPLAQEFLRLRKEQDKLKTLHESEKERIKAQFMRELELLSKRYEVMLQEEEASYTHKSSALESNLKKVEMNRRLAEVFRLKNAQDNTSMNSGAAGQEARSGVSQGQSYQQYPSLMTARSQPISATAGLPQTSGGPLSERQDRLPASSIMGAQLAGVGNLTNSSWNFSQGLTGNIVSGHSPQSAHVVSTGGAQLRSTMGASVQGSYIEPFRISSQLSPAVNAGAQRLSSQLSSSFLNTAMVSTAVGSTPHVHDSQGFNAVSMGNYLKGPSSHSYGTSHGIIPPNYVVPNANSATPQYNAQQVVTGSIFIAPATQSPARAQQESHLPLGGIAQFSDFQRNEAERLAHDPFASESVGRVLANNNESHAVESRYSTSAIQVSHGYSNTEAPIATTLQSFNVQNHVINGSGSSHSRYPSEGQDPEPSHVICLSDDD